MDGNNSQETNIYEELFKSYKMPKGGYSMVLKKDKIIDLFNFLGWKKRRSFLLVENIRAFLEKCITDSINGLPFCDIHEWSGYFDEDKFRLVIVGCLTEYSTHKGVNIDTLPPPNLIQYHAEKKLKDIIGKAICIAEEKNANEIKLEHFFLGMKEQTI